MTNFQSNSGSNEFRFVSSRVMAQQMGLSVETLKKYRLSGKLIEGIHWVRPPDQLKPISYNYHIMIDWLRNRSNPAAHRRAIEQDLASQLSNQRKISRTSRANLHKKTSELDKDG
jgi:hypothetical protein